jgi:hypothetical protein
VDDGPVAPAAEHSLSGLALDAACRAVLALPPHPALASPAWWDANAPARRVTYVQRPATPLPPAPWPARRALDFCAELALALAPVHEAGAAHGALRPGTVELRPDGGPLVHLPGGGAGPADDLHGVGVLLFQLLTGRSEHAGLAVAGEVGPAADAAELLQGLLAADPAARPDSARQVGERLAAIASSVPDTTRPPAPARAARRRSRLAAVLVLLVVAVAAGGYLVTQRVGPPGPTISPATVTVPEPPAVTP